MMVMVYFVLVLCCFMQDGHLPRVSGVGGSVRVVHVGGSPDSMKRPRIAIVEMSSRRLRSRCSGVRYY